MSDYSQVTDFSAKDALTTGDPEKIILGADVDAELAAIATAIATKFDTSNDGAGSGLDADSVDGVGPFAVGTWVPTFASLSNLDAVTNVKSNYIRIGTVVLVFGVWSVDITGAGAATFTATLPIASNFASTGDAGGSINSGTGFAYNGRFLANVAGDLLDAAIHSTASQSAVEMPFFGSYLII